MSFFKTIIGTSKTGAVKVASLYKPSNWREKGKLWATGVIIFTLFMAILLLGIYWSRTPDSFDVTEVALQQAGGDEAKIVPGFITTSTVVELANTILYKPGGYLTNDIMLPGVYLDNIPNWEFGVLVNIRDMTQALRNDYSRSQTQSVEDKDLIIADPQFHYDNDQWILPSTESEYKKGLKALERYRDRLANPSSRAQFYARADNLTDYLGYIEKRLGSLAQRLAASVADSRLNIDLAGDSTAQQSTPSSGRVDVKTSWFEIDDNFFEARGYTWALLHIFKATAIDFEGVLNKKNAVVSLNQIIEELESTQKAIWSPIILNGTGFGFVANHSLVMASYISRANAAVIDLRRLLQQG